MSRGLEHCRGVYVHYCWRAVDGTGCLVPLLLVGIVAIIAAVVVALVEHDRKGALYIVGLLASTSYEPTGIVFVSLSSSWCAYRLRQGRHSHVLIDTHGDQLLQRGSVCRERIISSILWHRDQILDGAFERPSLADGSLRIRASESARVPTTHMISHQP